MKTRLHSLRLLLVVLTALLSSSHPALIQGSGPPPQPADQIYNEMRTVYLANLARRDNGVQPLRWNAPMTDAARWFCWDSVENRPSGYCGHEDTLGRSPWERVPFFGYRGYCGAENCYCGYMTPEAAITGWMNSPGHRANLLDPNSREIGMGYYRRDSDGRGYLTQDFGHDPVYPPLIIDYEAPNTTDPSVDLYIYDRDGGGGFAGLGAATEMMVSNGNCFAGATWQTYTAEMPWTLESGTGWRTVYVKTRDAVGRSTVASDTIYLGQNVPLNELGLHLASTNSESVTIYRLNESWPSMQLSQNWFVDDTFDTFGLLWGNGERVNDAAALGGTAFRLRPGDGESSAWVWTTEFFKETPFVAHSRLKVSNNTLSSEVARIVVKGGGTQYGPISLKGTNFSAPDTYQEFPIAFTFHDSPEDAFLIFQFWRSGDADVTVDGVYIFTEPQPVQSPLTWAVPGSNYRNGGMWVQYTDGAGNYSPIEDADLTPEYLDVSPDALVFLAEVGMPSPPARMLTIRQAGCEPFTWTVSDDAAWLETQVVGGDMVQVSVDTTAMAIDSYQATITIEAQSGVLDSPVGIPAKLIVVEEIERHYLPLTLRTHQP